MEDRLYTLSHYLYARSRKITIIQRVFIGSLCWLSYCGLRSSEDSKSLPSWMLVFGGIRRDELLGISLQEILTIEGVSAYYLDSLGCVYRYLPKEGGRLWVEYYLDTLKRVRTLTLTWEHEDFSVLTQGYQRIRSFYTQRYGKAEGPVGNIHWKTPHKKHIHLRISPERRYIHLAMYAAE